MGIYGLREKQRNNYNCGHNRGVNCKRDQPFGSGALMSERGFGQEGLVEELVACGDGLSSGR